MTLSNDAGSGGNGILKLNGLLNIDSGSAYHYSITGQTYSLDANRTVTLPELVGNDEFVFKDHTQTLTNKTLTSPVLTTPQIKDDNSAHKYIFAGSEIAANRTVTLPILGGNDEFVFKDHTQTLTNKTLTSPTITGTGSIAGTFTGTLSAISWLNYRKSYFS